MVPGTLMQLPGNVYGPARAAHYEVSESAAGRHEQVMCSSFADCGTLTMCSSPPAKRGFLDLNKGATPPPPSPLCLLCQLWTRTPYREAQDAVGISGGNVRKNVRTDASIERQNRSQRECPMEYQKLCQVECPNECLNRMPEQMPQRMSE